MRRDWYTIKQILSDLADDIKEDDYEINEYLDAHYEMLEEAGLIEYVLERTGIEFLDEEIEVPRLTWKGQNLLEILEGNLIFNDKKITEEFRGSLI